MFTTFVSMSTSRSQENKELKLLMTITTNIEAKPNCAKYKSLNAKTVTQKLKKPYMDILMWCFDKSEDGTKLLFDETRLDTLPLLRQLVSSYHIDDIAELLAADFDLPQINDAMTQSDEIGMTDALDPDHEEEKQQTRKSIHDAKVQMLLDMGFNEPDTTVALQQSNGDITLAAQYVINAGHVMNLSPNDIETAYGEVQLRVNERMEQEGRMLTESEISDVMMKMNLRRVKAIWNKWEKENNVSLSITQRFVENAK
eukprot:743464_1